METEIPLGTKRVIDGQLRVFYYGYWIKAYDVPADTLQAKKRLIEALTRRLFNHVEHGLNIPGTRLKEARAAYETETEPERKRVKGAMLAGALFNRATDIFTKLVELQSLGIDIKSDNALMRECGHHLQEALSLGRLVLHRSGEEGIDELWGEPFKAFSIPLEDFYESRYVKIALTMRDADRIAQTLIDTVGSIPLFDGIEPLVKDLCDAAKIKTETLRTDVEIFDVWTTFVVCAERMSAFAPRYSNIPTPEELQASEDGLMLLEQGRDLISYITRARTPMPKSAAEFIEHCVRFRDGCASWMTDKQDEVE